MKRTNIFLSEAQRNGLKSAAKFYGTTPAHETRSAIDEYLEEFRKHLKSGAKMPRK